MKKDKKSKRMNVKGIIISPFIKRYEDKEGAVLQLESKGEYFDKYFKKDKIDEIINYVKNGINILPDDTLIGLKERDAYVSLTDSDCLDKKIIEITTVSPSEDILFGEKVTEVQLKLPKNIENVIYSTKCGYSSEDEPTLSFLYEGYKYKINLPLID